MWVSQYFLKRDREIQPLSLNWWTAPLLYWAIYFVVFDRQVDFVHVALGSFRSTSQTTLSSCTIMPFCFSCAARIEVSLLARHMSTMHWQLLNCYEHVSCVLSRVSLVHIA